MTAGARCVFVTHGGAGIGLGHVRRCLALAKSLATLGTESTFILGPDETVAGSVAGAGFHVTSVRWETDLSVAVAAVRASGPDTVVVDSYLATPDFFRALRAATGQVVAVDDLADRSLPVDVVVNGGIGAADLGYESGEGRLLLLGPPYAMIDAGYADAPARRHHDRIERVLVTLGGSLQPHALESAVAAVDTTLEDVVVDVVAGPYTGPTAALEGTVRRPGNRAAVHGYVPDLRRLMLQADLAISAGGMTLYELAATATPTIMVLTVANQGPNVRGFEQAGAALLAGAADRDETRPALEGRLRELARDPGRRAALATCGRRLVDGQGTWRVGRALTSSLSSRT
jgi:UDP-2,4-diacetamido-2,4,6-trideoxy-beta-L-altropyranose hydrolase